LPCTATRGSTAFSSSTAVGRPTSCCTSPGAGVQASVEAGVALEAGVVGNALAHAPRRADGQSDEAPYSHSIVAGGFEEMS
jgi:hypothetical protein